MAKGYWIARVDVDNQGAYDSYRALNAVAFAKYGAKFIVRGGAYGAGTPREGWDHATAYLRRILADLWGAELTVVEREFTLVGVNPALDDFADAAAFMHAQALESARDAGKALGVVA